MTKEQMKALHPGDVVQHISHAVGIRYLVWANYGDRVTLVATADMTNASEWKLLSKSVVVSIEGREE